MKLVFLLLTMIGVLCHSAFAQSPPFLHFSIDPAIDPRGNERGPTLLVFNGTELLAGDDEEFRLLSVATGQQSSALIQGFNSLAGHDVSSQPRAEAGDHEGDSIVFGMPQDHRLNGSFEYNVGSASVFRRDRDGIWRRAAALTSPDQAPGRSFGGSVALGSGMALIGEPGFAFSGQVHAYIPCCDWRRIQTITSPDPFPADGFGTAVAIDGLRAIISAPDHGRNGEGPLAYVYEWSRNNQSWEFRHRITPTNPPRFANVGTAVGIDGDLCVINSVLDSVRPGPVHTFRLTRGDPAVLDPIDGSALPGASTGFGTDLALKNGMLCIGDPGASRENVQSGAVWIYRWSGQQWVEVSKLTAEDPNERNFGRELSLHDGWLSVSSTVNIDGWDKPRIHFYELREDVDQAPRFITSPPATMLAGVANQWPVEAIDDDGTPVSLSLISAPPWLSMVTNGSGKADLTGIAPASLSSNSAVVIQASSGGERCYQTFDLRLIGADDTPRITGIPDTIRIMEGEETRLAPRISGPSPLAFQWFRNGEELVGQNEPSITVLGRAEESAGTYALEASNPAGTARSSDIAVHVREPDRFNRDWPNASYDRAQSSNLPTNLGIHAFVPAWTLPLDREIQPFSPVSADGMIFTGSRRRGGGLAVYVAAFDLATGQLIWRREFPDPSREAGHLSYFDGSLFFEQGGFGEVRLTRLDASNGEIEWLGELTTNAPGDGSPLISEAGALYRGHACLEPASGAFRYFRGPDIGSPAPHLLHLGRIYSHDDGYFREHGPGGFIRWAVGDMPNRNPLSLPVFSGNHAVIPGDRLHCLELDSRQIKWSRDYTHPRIGQTAISEDQIFVLHEDGVSAYELADGEPTTEFRLGVDGSNRRPLNRHPILFESHVAVCNSENTWIFDRATTETVQVIPLGNAVLYAGGYLVFRTPLGYEAWYANGAPAAKDDFSPTVEVPPSVPDLEFPLGSFFVDVDPGDSIAWRISNVTRPEIFRTLEIDPVKGDLTVVYNPWESGSSEVTITLTDSAGNVTTTTLSFRVPAHPEPVLEVSDQIVLNPQTGLYDHAITVTNSGVREVAGFDLVIGGLPENVTVNNASGMDAGNWIVNHRMVLLPEDSITLVLEYYAPVRGTSLDPNVAVSLVTAPDMDPIADQEGLAVDRCVFTDDGLLVEFASVPDTFYEIQYSNDGSVWKVSPILIRAAGTRTQWIDRGLPRTDSAPESTTSRFYRVRSIEPTN